MARIERPLRRQGVSKLACEHLGGIYTPWWEHRT